MLAAKAFHLVEVEPFIVLAHTVVVYFVEFARKIQVHAVGEVAPMGKAHGNDAVAWLERGEVDGHIGTGARMGLNIGCLGPEKLASAFYCQ